MVLVAVLSEQQNCRQRIQLAVLECSFQFVVAESHLFAEEIPGVEQSPSAAPKAIADSEAETADSEVEIGKYFEAETGQESLFAEDIDNQAGPVPTGPFLFVNVDAELVDEIMSSTVINLKTTMLRYLDIHRKKTWLLQALKRSFNLSWTFL